MQNYEMIFIFTIPLYSLSIFFLLNTLFTERIFENSKKIEIASYITYSFLLMIIFLLVRAPIVFLTFNISSFFLISLNYFAKLFSRAVKIVCIYFVFLVIELTISGVIGFLDIHAFENSQFNSIIGIILIRLTTVIVSYFIYKFKKGIQIDFPIPTYYYFIHLLILFGTLYLFIISLEKENLTLCEVIISSIIVTLVNLLIIFFEEKIYYAMKIYTEGNTLKLQNIAYENQSEIINQSLTTIKSLKHDMKNHILCLNSLFESNKKEEVKEYIQVIIDQIEGNRQLLQSNNFIVDSIVNFKLQELRNINVEVNIEVNIPQNINILAYDLTIILGNLFDNAIDALKEIPTENERKFAFSMTYGKGNIIILMDNSFSSNKLKIQDGRLQTTKTLKANHGLGICSMERVVKKYEGKFQLEYSDNIFSVAVLIPCFD